jgi:hypothetical protein
MTGIFQENICMGVCHTLALLPFTIFFKIILRPKEKKKLKIKNYNGIPNISPCINIIFKKCS